MPELTSEAIEIARKHKLVLDEQESKRLMHEARRARRRTVFMSIICSGLVALFLGNVFEAKSYNAQAHRSRANCHAVQSVATNLAQIATDVSVSSPEPAVKLRWSKYAGIFASSVPPLAPSCEQIFPNRSEIPFIK